MGDEIKIGDTVEAISDNPGPNGVKIGDRFVVGVIEVIESDTLPSDTLPSEYDMIRNVDKTKSGYRHRFRKVGTTPVLRIGDRVRVSDKPSRFNAAGRGAEFTIDHIVSHPGGRVCFPFQGNGAWEEDLVLVPSDTSGLEIKNLEIKNLEAKLAVHTKRVAELESDLNEVSMRRDNWRIRAEKAETEVACANLVIQALQHKAGIVNSEVYEDPKMGLKTVVLTKEGK